MSVFNLDKFVSLIILMGTCFKFFTEKVYKYIWKRAYYKSDNGEAKNTF